jgi:hypothetical protein
MYSDFTLSMPMYNHDDVQGPYLYSILRNHDVSNNTGTISIAFLVR